MGLVSLCAFLLCFIHAILEIRKPVFVAISCLKDVGVCSIGLTELIVAPHPSTGERKYPAATTGSNVRWRKGCSCDEHRAVFVPLLATKLHACSN